VGIGPAGRTGPVLKYVDTVHFGGSYWDVKVNSVNILKEWFP
jgi:hypothetical protein